MKKINMNKKKSKKSKKKYLKKQNKELNKNSIFSKICKVVSALIVGLGLIITLYNFSTRIDVSPGNPLKPLDPFSTPFTVKNESLFDIYNVLFSYEIRHAYSTKSHSQATNVGVSHKTPPIKVIKPGESTTVFPSLPIFKTASTYADIEIVVFYRPKWLFWKKHKGFHFVTVKKADDTFCWIPKALSE